MCGRYTLIRLADLVHVFPWITTVPGFTPRYNVAPGTPIPVIANDRPERFDLFVWGLVPSWAKDPAIGNKLINARAETLAEKPSFRTALRRRRCVIPADGFYEWKANPAEGGKTPMYIRLKTGRPFGFAGLWDTRHGPGGEEMRSCTIITTAPNDLVAPIHNRMPVILPPEGYETWLDPGEATPEDLQPLLAPYPADRMEAYPVSRRVNKPGVEGPELVHPAAAPTGGLFPDV